MASGRFNLTNHGNTSTYTTYYTEYVATPNNDGNFSMITVWVKCDKSSASTQRTAFTANTTVTVSGSNPEKQEELNFWFQIYPGETGKLLFAKAGFKVPHNQDGSKTITISVTMDGNTVAQSSGSSVITLDKIPRATELPAIGLLEIESNFNLQLNPQLSNPTHSVELWFGNLKQWVQDDGSLGSTERKLSGKNIVIQVPKEYYSQFSGPSGEGSIRLCTYNGNNKVGESARAFKVACNPSLCTPIINATAIDTNNISVGLTGDGSNVIANVSKVLITPTIQISDTDDTTAYITSKSIDGTVFTTDTAMMFGPTKKDFLLRVTNSRGFTAEKTISLTGNLIPYILLTFNVDELYRPESTGSDIILKYSGKYFAGEFTNETITSDNLFVGNNLTYNNIKCAFPDNLWELMGTDDTNVDIVTTDQFKIYYYVGTSTEANQTVYGVTLVSLTEPDTYFLELYNASGNIGETPTVYTNSSNLIMDMDFGIINSVNSNDTVVYPYITKTTVEEAVKNELTLWWKYKTGNNEYVDGGTLTPVIDSEKNTYSGEVTLGNGFDYQNQYDFQFFYKDKIVGIENDKFAPGTVTRGIPVFWWTKDSFHIEGDLYVEGQINPS